MQKRILVAKPSGAQRKMLNDTSGRLTVDGIPICQSVFQAGDYTVNVILAHLSDVLEQERHRFQATVSDVEIGRAVLVEDSGDTSEGTASFLQDSFSNASRRRGAALTATIAIATVEQTRD